MPMSITLMLFVLALGSPDPGGQAKPVPPSAPKAAPRSAEENYKALCLPCHGPEGKGLLPAMSLTDGTWKHGSTLPALTRTISEGVKGTMMLPFKDKLSRAEILELAKFARQFDPKFKSKGPAK